MPSSRLDSRESRDTSGNITIGAGSCLELQAYGKGPADFAGSFERVGEVVQQAVFVSPVALARVRPVRTNRWPDGSCRAHTASGRPTTP